MSEQDSKCAHCHRPYVVACSIADDPVYCTRGCEDCGAWREGEGSPHLSSCGTQTGKFLHDERVKLTAKGRAHAERH